MAIGFDELGRRLDGEMSGDEMKAAENALAADAELRAAMDRLARDAGLVEKSLEGLSLGEGLAERVLARLPRNSVRAASDAAPARAGEAATAGADRAGSFVSLAASLAALALVVYFFPFGISSLPSGFESVSLAGIARLCGGGFFFLGILCLTFAGQIVKLESRLVSLLSGGARRAGGLDVLFVRAAGAAMAAASLLFLQ